ncbi:MAG TPA: flavodoxin domain-containing protein [Gemmatimonadales bacterium]|nr:flavodoxin domain-containing protein [Gemmatimonadales bacterium]
MSNILVIYGSTYGQTERIARRIGELLHQAGYLVDTHRGDRLPEHLTLETYSGVVVAASVLAGYHQRYIRTFVRHNAARLNRLASAFVSVCGSAGSDPAKASAYIEGLLEESGWRPMITRSFTGGVAYTKYSWPVRWVLKRINRSKGLPTDTSRDWDFTEWREVDAFARSLAALFAAPIRRQAQLASAAGAK